MHSTEATIKDAKVLLSIERLKTPLVHIKDKKWEEGDVTKIRTVILFLLLFPFSRV